MNKAILIGNLGHDVKMQTTQSGKVVGEFPIAVSESYGDEKKVSWFNIVAWGKTAKNCEKYLSKGKKVAVVGRIAIKQYEDKNGDKKTAVNIIAENIEFLSTRTENGSKNDREMVPLTKEEEDELPF